MSWAIPGGAGWHGVVVGTGPMGDMPRGNNVAGAMGTTASLCGDIEGGNEAQQQQSLPADHAGPTVPPETATTAPTPHAGSIVRCRMDGNTTRSSASANYDRGPRDRSHARAQRRESVREVIGAGRR